MTLFSKLVTGLALSANYVLATEPQLLSVTIDSATGNYIVQEGVKDTNANAYGYFYPEYNASGWGYLDVHMQTAVTSIEQQLQYGNALGYVEGYLTCNTLQTFYPNFYSAVFGSSGANNETIQFINDNYNWMVSKANEFYQTDDYWYAVKLQLNRINGIYQGLIEGCPEAKNIQSEIDYSTLVQSSTLTHILLMNAWGDLYQITAKYAIPNNDKPFKYGRGGLRKLRESATFVERCSAIIKLLPNNEDVVFGHATWDTYESLGPRIIKHMHYPLLQINNNNIVQYDIYFSSSPGLISSVDDFFTMNGYTNLGVIETTNDMLNIKLLDLVQPQSVLSYMRAVISNQNAKNGHDWAELFSKYQSGTYTNQWMVMDLTKFTPSQLPKQGFLTVLEEVPGHVHWDDMTSTLSRDTYWPSYNNPYFKDIQELSGYAAACSKSEEWCWDTAPRANIFRERHTLITDVTGGQQILAYNDFKNDPLSLGDSCNAPACRGDLEPEFSARGPFGALDAKVTSAVQALKRSGEYLPTISARLGPTTDQQKPFCWSQLPKKQEEQYSHNGQPDCFNFEWQNILPTAATEV